MQQISMDSALTGLFVVMILLLLFYDALKRLYPGLDTLFMLFGQVVGLVFLVLRVVCIAGLGLGVIRRLRRRCRRV